VLTSENHLPRPFVWKDDMQSRALPGRIGGSLATTSGRDHAAARLAALGDVELDRAFRLAGLMLGDAAEAEDAAQEAILRAWRSAGSLRDPDGFDAWLDRILVNVCRDRLRRRGRIRWISLEEGHDGAAPDPFAALLERDALLGSLRTLDPDELSVVVLHYWADLTLEAVAVRVGAPVGTVKSRLHRALERIRQQEDASSAAESLR
jgi:RNA polymerase sigma-70 factor (ECF subfamily)